MPPNTWLLEAEVPTQEDLLSIWGANRNQIWAVGWNGTIVHYNGTAWVQETSNTSVPLTSIHGWADPNADPAAPPAFLFATGWDGTLLSRNLDGTWVDAKPGLTIEEDLFAVSVPRSTNALAVGDSGRVLGWDGAAWQIIPFLVPSDFPPNDLIEPRGALKAVWSQTNGTRYYLSGSGGAIYRSTNGFLRFDALDSAVGDPLRGIWGTGNSNVYVVGLDSLILRFGGGQWNEIRNNGADELPTTFLFGITGTSPDDITVAGWRGHVFRFNGERWSQETTETTKDFRAIWQDPETTVAFAVGASGMVMRRDPPPPPAEATPE